MRGGGSNNSEDGSLPTSVSWRAASQGSCVPVFGWGRVELGAGGDGGATDGKFADDGEILGSSLSYPLPELCGSDRVGNRG